MSSVVFAPTLAAARKAGRTLRDPRPASPGRDGALDEAFRRGFAVRFCAPKKDEAFWKLVRRRYWLPTAPVLLREAIGGIARHEMPEEPLSGRRGTRSRGRLQALWLEGELTDARAASLLESSGEVTLWVIEDFRKLAASDAVLRRLENVGIQIATLRPLRASMLRSRA